jgi:predicted acyl esterase
MSLALREVRALDMTMRDGVRLTGDLYRPVEGRHPVLVMRQPYGRKIGSTVVLAHPAWYAAQGYLALVQDVRGRGDSEGLFRVLEDDVEDGAATLALARDLDGGDGRVASYGFSYHGMNQYMALAGGGAPDAMAIVMAAFDVRDHWAYEGGAFRLALGRMWARQMAVETARRAILRRRRGSRAILRPCRRRATRIISTGSPTIPPIGRASLQRAACPRRRPTCPCSTSAAGTTSCWRAHWPPIARSRAAA